VTEFVKGGAMRPDTAEVFGIGPARRTLSFAISNTAPVLVLRRKAPQAE